MKIVIAGATGFIGQRLVRDVRARGDEVVVLTRDVDRARSSLGPDIEILPWKPPRSGPWTRVFSEADAVVNLAGEPLMDKRWTRSQKDRIVSSRVDATKAIVTALEGAAPRPKVLVNGSAVGYYGSPGDIDITEASPPGTDFLSWVVQEWEAAAAPAQALGVRLALIRTGIVLGSQGGALPKMELPFRLFLGGTMGGTGQWVSWIHLDDEIALILFALDGDQISGPLNATAPTPVTMSQFCREIGQAMGRPSWVPMMAQVLRVALGERSRAALSSQRVLPCAALAAGFEFRYSVSDQALRSILAET